MATSEREREREIIDKKRENREKQRKSNPHHVLRILSLKKEATFSTAPILNMA